MPQYYENSKNYEHVKYRTAQKEREGGLLHCVAEEIIF
jgi:hypothetical protein